jgi:ribosomal protein S18 acetylase RimI-like enzyme
MTNAPSDFLENVESRLTKRPATEADTEFARKTHHTSYRDVIVKQFGDFEEKVQDEFFAKSWKPETHQILLYGDEECGYFSYEVFDDHIFAHELVLLPAFQGKGIGSQVLQDLMEEAKRRGLPVRLQVLRENKAQHLYRKLGFKDAGSTDTHIQMEFDPRLH